MGRGQSRNNTRGRGRGGGRGGSRGRGGRGGSAGRGSSRGGGRTSAKEDGKINRWNTAEDVPMDEEDEFFAARDKILLDDTARARARAGPGIGDEDDFDEDDEVFGLDGVGEYSSEEDGEDEEMEDLEDEPPAPRSKAKAKAKAVAQAESDSDESTDSEEELAHWGKSRSAYYADNSRVMDEDDTEAREMEEREGRRLQAKLIAEIGEDDWGFNDQHSSSEDAADALSAVPVTPPLPTDKASLMRHMEKYDPLSLALARDWEDIAYQVLETSQAVKEVEAESPDDPALGLMHLHHQTLLTYASTLAFYLHLQSTPTDADPSTSSTLAPTEAKRLRTEVIARLLTLKQALATLEDLGFAADDEDLGDSDEDDISLDDEHTDWLENGGSDESDEEDEATDDDVSPYGLKPGEKVSHANGGTPRLENLEEEWQKEKIAGWVGPSLSTGDKTKKKKSGPKLGKLEEGELEALMQDALDLEGSPPSSSSPKNKKKGNAPEPSEKEKKKKKSVASAAPVFDLVEPEFAATKSKGKKSKQDSMSKADVESEAFGDPTQLSHTDASDKAGRRKSLRFHTSKIESASNRRSAARAGMGGDDDLPYRERRKEQKRRGLGEGGDDLDDVDMEADTGIDTDAASTGKRTRDTSSPVDDDGEEGEDGYYDLVRKAKKQRKEEKKAEYESARAAERIDPDEDAASGPRSLTRAILKNRGMMPSRSPKNKAARNPRVKKKLQYAKAKKKLGSRQAVFKGGAEVAAAREGRYEGEKSGISGRVVKSVKL